MRTGIWPLPPPKTVGKGDASGSSGGGAANPYAAVVNMREQLWAEDLVLANNDPVASWTARTGLNADQAVAGNRPTYKSSVAFLNSKPAVYFALDDFLRTAVLAHGIGAGAFWFLAVFGTDTTSGAYAGIAANGAFVPGLYRSAANVNYYVGGDNMPTPTFGMVANTKYIWEVVRTAGGSCQHYKNGAAL